MDFFFIEVPIIYYICIYNIFCDVSVFFGVDEGAKGGIKIKSIFIQDSVWCPGLMMSVIFFDFWMFSEFGLFLPMSYFARYAAYGI